MNIKYDEKTKSFYLNTKNTSYVFFINEAGRAEHLYYGESVDCCDLRYMAVRRSYSFAPYDKDYGEELSPDSVFCEIPCENSGDFRPCALGISGKSVDFKYVSHRIYNGAEKIKGLPCSDGDGAESLEIIFSDKIEGVSLRFTYAVYFDCDIISRRAEIINNSRGELRINKAAYSLDLYGRDYDLLELYGTYYRERAEVQRTPLKFGFQGSFSHKGASGHESNPFIAVCENSADEQKGRAYGFNLVYSGNFDSGAYVDKTGNTRVLTGISEYGFDWRLGSGESFALPESVVTFSSSGIGGMSRNFHDFIRGHIVPKRFAFSHRPVAVNTWEAAYFNVNEAEVLSMALAAKDIGAELVVLDDGWFRANDKEGLGDWQTRKDAFPSGLKALSDKIHAHGLKFGIWFEPEMISENSELYRKHSDWVLGAKNGKLGRHQLVLDMGRHKVVDYVFERMCTALDGVKVEYLKWDMNRYISEVSSGEAFHRYILGVYDLLGRVTSRFPDMMIESCAGGGGRFDLGMLCYSPQIWTSDNTDPIMRIDVQLGTSVAYPCSAISCHFTNSDVSGIVSFDEFRYAAAAFGTYGYELDPRKASDERKAKLKKFTEQNAENEQLVLSGDLYRLACGDNIKAYMQVSKDKSFALLTALQFVYNPSEQVVSLRLRGLDENVVYKCSADGKLYGGKALMRVGYRIYCPFGHSGAIAYTRFEKVKG